MKILVLGASGFVGRWVVKILRKLQAPAYVIETSLSLGVDLTHPVEASNLFERVNPEYVINCAAFVGGIQYGYRYPAEIFYKNSQMILNIFENCRRYKVKRLINPISNCAYPASETFFKEENFWNGPLHESVLSYGITRRMMGVGAWAYDRQYGLDIINLVLSNMYGPGDHFNEIRSHALGAILKKVVEAKISGERKVVIWGTGNPVREWLYVQEGAEALVRAIHMQPYVDIINVGTGEGISIKELAFLIKKIAGWNGEFVFDISKPDGALFKTVDGLKGERLLGFKPKIRLEEGIKITVESYMMTRG